MESGKRDSKDGSRLVYVLTQIAKVLDLTEIVSGPNADTLPDQVRE